jgi:hypothetical protein
VKIAKDIEDTTYFTDSKHSKHDSFISDSTAKINQLESHLAHQEKLIEKSKEQYLQKKYSKTPNSRTIVNTNTCFPCSVEYLMGEILDPVEETKSQICEDTKRMTQFSADGGYTGQGKFCSQCRRECVYV